MGVGVNIYFGFSIRPLLGDNHSSFEMIRKSILFLFCYSISLVDVLSDDYEFPIAVVEQIKLSSLNAFYITELKVGLVLHFLESKWNFWSHLNQIINQINLILIDMIWWNTEVTSNSTHSRGEKFLRVKKVVKNSKR